jgi:hypothetical protein
MGHGKFGGKGMILVTPLLSRWLDTGSTFFVLTQCRVVGSFSRSCF